MVYPRESIVPQELYYTRKELETENGKMYRKKENPVYEGPPVYPEKC
ncbi:MAG: hypothetical protein PVI11_00865 [Candidatus Aminicenantes bacterium]